MSATTINGNARRLPRGAILGTDGKLMNARSLLEARAQHVLSMGSSGYANYGANTTKNSLLGWLWRGGDADKDIGLNVQVLRERSRDAFMGIPLAAAGVETFDTNVIGEGLFPAPNVDGDVLGLDEQETADLNRELATKFLWWAQDPRECDWEAKHNFFMLQSVAFKSMLLSGDCPVLFPLKARPLTLFELKLRVLEADRIMNPTLAPFYPNVNLFNGVELNNDGELTAYHISDRHPLASARSSLPLPQKTFRITPFGEASGRRNMVLLIKPERPEQRRGVPILSVCLELLKQHGRFIDSTVVAAVIQSYFTAFITSEFPDQTIFDDLLTEEQKNEITNLNPYNVQLGPGVVNFMRPGHAVNFAHPTQPLANFGEFTISVAKFIGAALGMPYEVLLKQFNASYSASRAALLDFWKRVRKYRAQMIDQFCQPAYEEWLADAIGLGRIELFKGGFDDPLVRKAMLRCIWTGASAGSLDPQKEVIAADLKVKCGFSTIERESAELNGSNYRDNIRQQAVEHEEFEEADLLYPPYRPTMIGTSPTLLPGQEKPAPPKPPPAAAPPAQPPPPKSHARVSRKKRTRANSHVALASGTSGRFER
jgi:lambda family phage portal protein